MPAVKSATFKIQESRTNSSRGVGISIMSGGKQKQLKRKKVLEAEKLDDEPSIDKIKKSYASEVRQVDLADQVAKLYQEGKEMK